MTNGLPAVSIVEVPAPADTNSPPALYAIVSTNTESFAVYRGNRLVGAHDLPMYPDPVGKMERTALSPVAVTVDVTLVAGALYFWIIAPNNNCWPN